MTLDFAALRWAKVENLERLARSLRLVLPARRSKDQYQRALARVLAAALDKSVEVRGAE